MWPIISERLYNAIDGYGVHKITDLAKTIHHFSNNVVGLSQIDPLNVHPDLGLFKKHSDFGFSRSQIYSFDNALNNITLSDINRDSFGESKTKEYGLFFYIGSRAMTNEELEEAAKIKNRFPEYYEGIINGWSVMVLPGEKKAIVHPGVVSKEKFIQLKQEDIISFYNSDTINFLDEKTYSLKSINTMV